jgi:hypothetical protein
MDDRGVEELLAYLERLLARLEEMPGSEGDLARDAISALSEVYGETLARTVRLAGTAPDPVRALAADPLVGHLMALHGLHPDPPQLRVEQAISDITSELRGQGSVDFDGIHGGVAQLRVTAAGCGSGDLAATVRDIVLGSAPDLADVDAASGNSSFIPIEAIGRKAPQ